LDVEREINTAIVSLRTLGARHDLLRAEGLRSQAGATASHGSESQLTDRQTQILRLIADGMNNAEIARRLRLSEHTVKRHVANLLLRLGVSSRASAVAAAARQGILSGNAGQR
jgi:DNA-binding NarL/FixJ family response regulator